VARDLIVALEQRLAAVERKYGELDAKMLDAEFKATVDHVRR
jgi:hypothetical protein